MQQKIKIDKFKTVGQNLIMDVSSSNSSHKLAVENSQQNVIDSFQSIVESLLLSMGKDKCKGHNNGTCPHGSDDADKLKAAKDHTIRQFAVPPAIVLPIDDDYKTQERLQQEQPVLVGQKLSLALVSGDKIPPAAAALEAAEKAAEMLLLDNITKIVLNEKKADDISERFSSGKGPASTSQRIDQPIIKKRSSYGTKIQDGVNSLLAAKRGSDAIKARGSEKIRSIIKTPLAGDKSDKLETNKRSVADIIDLDADLNGNDRVERGQESQAIKSIFSFVPPASLLPMLHANDAKPTISKEQFVQILSSSNKTSSDIIQSSLERWLALHKVKKAMSFMHFG